MANPEAIRKNVAKAKEGLERTKIPALNKSLKSKKDQLSAEKDPSMKNAIRAEIKYIQEKIKAARAGVPISEDRSMNILEKIDRHLGKKKMLNESSNSGLLSMSDMERLGNLSGNDIARSFKNSGEYIGNMVVKGSEFKGFTAGHDKVQAVYQIISIDPDAESESSSGKVFISIDEKNQLHGEW